MAEQQTTPSENGARDELSNSGASYLWPLKLRQTKRKWHWRLRLPAVQAAFQVFNCRCGQFLPCLTAQFRKCIPQNKFWWRPLCFVSIRDLYARPTLYHWATSLGHFPFSCFKFLNRISLTCSGWPWIHSVAQASTDLVTLLAHALKQQELKACTTTCLRLYCSKERKSWDRTWNKNPLLDLSYRFLILQRDKSTHGLWYHE